MNGFSSADMSTAAANGHAEGYQAGYSDAVKAFDAAQPAAAQEAVAWQVGDEFYTSESLAIEGIQQWGPSGAIAIPLYAAPVAAAPVDGWDAQAYRQMAGELESWKQRALTAEGDFNRLHNAMNAEDGPTHMGEPVLSTPAAPGIDLEQFREAVENLEWQNRGHANPDFPTGDPEKHVECLRLLALIDASPKGGNRGRYFCDGPEGHFFCDDLKLARDLVNAYDKDDDWTITDLQATSAEVGGCTQSGKCDCIGACKYGRTGHGAGVSDGN